MQELSASFPEDVEFSVPFDTSQFVSVAITKVVHTLLEAMVLVFLVMFLFLQNFRYTLIPTIVVPVCLLGTFGVMSVLGFSVNMMTMFGMVLAIGILVDDAIVVVENVERIMAEEGLPPREATIKAMEQVSGAIIGITLVLSAVFLPLAFMSGSVGVIYQQFSLSLAVSILFSGFSGADLYAGVVRHLPQAYSRRGITTRRKASSAASTACLQPPDRAASKRLNSRLVKRTGRYMVIYVAIVAVLGVLYVRVPESFVPAGRPGLRHRRRAVAAGRYATTRTDKVVADVEEHLMSLDAMGDAFTVMGFSFSGTGQNAGIAFPTLKDWSERGKGQAAALTSRQ